MRFVSEDILIISISAQAVIPANAASPVWAHYLCHKNTISMIITGFVYKPEHKASALKISGGKRRGWEKFNKSWRDTKLPRLIIQHVILKQARMRTGTSWSSSLFITPDLCKCWIDGALRTFTRLNTFYGPMNLKCILMCLQNWPRIS